MPKKVHGRPAKARNRPRRTTPGLAAGTNPYEATIVAEAVPSSTPMTSSGLATSNGVSTSATATAAARIGPAAARRAASSARRVAATTVNYDYLRRDIRTLAVMAPVMVVVLVVAFIVLH